VFQPTRLEPYDADRLADRCRHRGSPWWFKAWLVAGGYVRLRDARRRHLRFVNPVIGPVRCGLGTAPLGSSLEGPLWWGPQDHVVAVDTVLAAIDAGAAFIDTAPFYGWGRAERIVGEALRQIPSHAPILTKCGTIRRDDGTFVEDTSPAAVRADVLASRERLGVARIDVVQIHDPDPQTPIERAWEALMDLVEEGVVGAAGLSNHDAGLMDRAIAVGPVTVVQHQYSLLHRDPETDGTAAWCVQHDVPFLAWSPLASGFLTDAFDLGALHPTDLRRNLRWATTAAERPRRVRALLADVAERQDTTISHVALSWLMARGAHPIVGARTPDEARQAMRPALDLTAEDFAPTT
jgi:aryl-alcohol dehydrogenase-like predicted oxidoreductase